MTFLWGIINAFRVPKSVPRAATELLKRPPVPPNIPDQATAREPRHSLGQEENWWAQGSLELKRVGVTVVIYTADK